MAQAPGLGERQQPENGQARCMALAPVFKEWGRDSASYTVLGEGKKQHATDGLAQLQKCCHKLLADGGISKPLLIINHLGPRS